MATCEALKASAHSCHRSGAPRELQEILWKGGGLCVEDSNVATHVVVAAGADRRCELAALCFVF